MTQEQTEKKYNEEKQLQFFIRGIKVSDGDFSLDAAACFDRNDAREESKKFLKFRLYKLELDKNQNL